MGPLAGSGADQKRFTRSTCHAVALLSAACEGPCKYPPRLQGKILLPLVRHLEERQWLKMSGNGAFGANNGPEGLPWPAHPRQDPAKGQSGTQGLIFHDTRPEHLCECTIKFLSLSNINRLEQTYIVFS